jgi:hypothetical protein
MMDNFFLPLSLLSLLSTFQMPRVEQQLSTEKNMPEVVLQLSNFIPEMEIALGRATKNATIFFLFFFG